MKKILFGLVAGLPVMVAAQSATVKGSLGNVGNVATVYYAYSNGETTVIDSARVVNNTYAFNVNAEMPVLVTLFSVNPNEKRPAASERVAAYLQDGINTVVSADSFSNIQVKESKAHAEYQKLNAATLGIQKEMRALGATYSKLKADNDEAGIKKLQEDYEVLQAKMNDVYGNYAKGNPTSPVALYALKQYAGYDIDPVKVTPLYEALTAAARQSGEGKKFAKKLAIAKATSVGAMAPEFSQADTAGKTIHLASFKGKYVLVDFWASWCGPCRAENPNVVEAFNRYKDKNFTVLGVSLDDAESDGQKKWLAAIAKDKLAWTQVSDLKGWQNEVAAQYGIQAIPQNLLLDPSGKIIAKNIRGEVLQQKLAELIK